MTDQQWTPSASELADLELVTSGAWPTEVPFAVDLPDDVTGEVELLDPEGVPLAVLDTRTDEVRPLSHPEFGPFRRYYRSPAQVRDEHPRATAALVRAPLTDGDLTALSAVEGSLLLLVGTGPGTPRGITAPALVRATLVAARTLPDAQVVAVGLAEHGEDFAAAVTAAYADETLVLAHEGTPAPAIQPILDADQPPPDERGLVVFFTGLSGSGKSTLARALHDVVLERGARTITSLDGDVVRHHLSKGLGFSKEDRETNIARIGWVAAEIARHRGVAICSPIAPFDSTRRLVRTMVEEAGGTFALVHVATPLEECERRDRKGLYAKARAGVIPEFTGISSPYEEPEDALVRVDTTGRTIGDVLDEVLDALATVGVRSAP